MKAMWVVVCVLVAVVICGPAPGVESFDRLVPEETVVFVSVGDVPEFLARIKETPAYKVLWEGDLFGDLLGDLYAEYPAAAPVVKVRSFWKECVGPLGQILNGEVAFALIRFDGAGGDPSLVVLADVSDGGEAALAKYLEEVIDPLLEEEGIEPEEVTCRGAALTRIVPDAEHPDKAIIFGVRDGVLMVSVETELLEEVMALRADAAGKRLSANAGYVDVKRAVGAADVQVYCALGEVIGEWLAEEEGQAKAWMEAVGVSGVRALGFGATLGPEGGTTTLRVSTDGAPGGWLGALVRGGDALKSVKYVPNDAALYWVLNLPSFHGFYKEIVAGVEAVSKETGGPELEQFSGGVKMLEVALGMKLEEEVLGAFGGELAVSVKIPDVLGVPPAAVLIEVKDKAAVEKFVARVLELIEASSDGAVEMASATYGGTKVTTVLASDQITPAVAVLDDFLVVGTGPDVVRNIIDTAAGGPNISSKEDFRAAMSGLPAGGATRMYLDMKGVYEFVFPLMAAEATGMEEGPMAELVKRFGALGEELSGVGRVLTGDESGFTHITHCASGPYTPTMIASVAIVPALGRARDAARQAASINNVKQLSAAVQMYTLDHGGALPERLSDLVPEYVGDVDVFVHPKSGTSPKLIDLEKPETIDEHADYELVVRGNVKGFEEPEKVVLIREKAQFSKKGRVVGYLDGHVEVVREEGGEARVVKAKGQIATFSVAVKMYSIDMGRCPTAEEGLKALIEEPADEALARSWKGPYVKVADGIPLDPWGNEYIYMSPGEGGAEFEIISLGKDGAVGGEGENADISSERLGE